MAAHACIHRSRPVRIPTRRTNGGAAWRARTKSLSRAALHTSRSPRWGARLHDGTVRPAIATSAQPRHGLARLAVDRGEGSRPRQGNSTAGGQSMQARETRPSLRQRTPHRCSQALQNVTIRPFGKTSPAEPPLRYEPCGAASCQGFGECGKRHRLACEISPLAHGEPFLHRSPQSTSCAHAAQIARRAIREMSVQTSPAERERASRRRAESPARDWQHTGPIVADLGLSPRHLPQCAC